jgi:hypothetical protein
VLDKRQSPFTHFQRAVAQQLGPDSQHRLDRLSPVGVGAMVDPYRQKLGKAFGGGDQRGGEIVVAGYRLSLQTRADAARTAGFRRGGSNRPLSACRS